MRRINAFLHGRKISKRHVTKSIKAKLCLSQTHILKHTLDLWEETNIKNDELMSKNWALVLWTASTSADIH